jgi:alkylation response protein AidB-like acyl-CoA dehydrogenase
MAAPDVLKPDHSAARRHFIFTDEHEQLRESIRSFMVREVTPHAEEWEETTFPDWVFRRMGELGSLGPSMTERCGGQDREYYCTSCSPRDGALALRRPGDARADRHGAPTDLRVRHRRVKQAYLAPAIRGEQSPAWASASLTRARTCPASRRAPCSTATTG